jgi:DNA-3-methyladenine glycosylase I
MNRFKRMQDIPAKTEMSEKLAKELKTRGFKFCGPVIVYAFAQAIGMVNDHIVSCHRYEACAKLAAQPRPR